MIVHHTIAGPPQAPVIVLSSGLGGAGSYWDELLPSLIPHFRVITYDHRGTGKSPDKLIEHYSINQMAEDVLELMSSLSLDAFHFVGHALGGLVGLQIALDQPDKLISLSLINAWSRPNIHTERCFAIRREILRSSGPGPYVQAQRIFLYPADWIVANAERLQKDEEHALKGFPGVDNTFARIEALLDFNLDERLGAITVPALIIANKDDTLIPWTASVRLAEAIAGATLEVFDYGGHAVNVTCPARFNAVLEGFLSRQSNPSQDRGNAS
jgi:aminoacrylate hydrolase